MKNQKGITLIALVITIIVLLILAGVSIAMLTGDNGILTQANKSQITTIEGNVNEKVRLGVQAVKLVIANQTALDNSWDAKADVKTAGTTAITCSSTTASDTTQGFIVASLIDDLKDEGYTITGSLDGSTITIDYTGEDYKNATNDPNAKISYTLNVTQHEVSISSSSPTLTKK